MKPLVRIHIGGYHASRRPSVIYTLLGSCVAVCLFDPVRRIGGMNHILLPGEADLKHFDAAARYGINAMELLINSIMRLGGLRSRLKAKVFGGAHTLNTIPEAYSMGRRNVEFTMEFLEKESIEVLNQDVGGHQSRRIYYHTDTNEIFLKRGKIIQYTHINKREQRVRERIRKEIDQSGEITLFDE